MLSAQVSGPHSFDLVEDLEQDEVYANVGFSFYKQNQTKLSTAAPCNGGQVGPFWSSGECRVFVRLLCALALILLFRQTPFTQAYTITSHSMGVSRTERVG